MRGEKKKAPLEGFITSVIFGEEEGGKDWDEARTLEGRVAVIY